MLNGKFLQKLISLCKHSFSNLFKVTMPELSSFASQVQQFTFYQETFSLKDGETLDNIIFLPPPSD